MCLCVYLLVLTTGCTKVAASFIIKIIFIFTIFNLIPIPTFVSVLDQSASLYCGKIYYQTAPWTLSDVQKHISYFSCIVKRRLKIIKVTGMKKQKNVAPVAHNFMKCLYSFTTWWLHIFRRIWKTVVTAEKTNQLVKPKMKYDSSAQDVRELLVPVCRDKFIYFYDSTDRILMEVYVFLINLNHLCL